MDDIVGAIPPWLPQKAFRVGTGAYPYKYHHSVIVQHQFLPYRKFMEMSKGASQRR